MEECQLGRTAPAGGKYRQWEVEVDLWQRELTASTTVQTQPTSGLLHSKTRWGLQVEGRGAVPSTLNVPLSAARRVLRGVIGSPSPHDGPPGSVAVKAETVTHKSVDVQQSSDASVPSVLSPSDPPRLPVCQ